MFGRYTSQKTLNTSQIAYMTFQYLMVKKIPAYLLIQASLLSDD